MENMSLEKQKQYEEEMLKFIKTHKIMQWSHMIWKSLSFSRATAYNYQLDKLDTIKDAFEVNRNDAANYLLQKWIKSDNATLNIAAMRIVADDESRRKLNQSYVDHTTNGKNVGFPLLNIDPLADGTESNYSTKEDS